MERIKYIIEFGENEWYVFSKQEAKLVARDLSQVYGDVNVLEMVEYIKGSLSLTISLTNIEWAER